MHPRARGIALPHFKFARPGRLDILLRGCSMFDLRTQFPAETPEEGDDVEARSDLIERLFREHNDALLRFLALRLRSYQEAKEVAQEAYVRVLSLDSPGAVSFLRAFLFKTAANLAVDRLRHRARGRRITDAGMFDELREPASPESEAASEQEIAILERLVGELPPKCRAAFLLYKIHGLEFPQVAERMGLSERMVRLYVVRAVAYCRVGLDAALAGKEARRG